MFKRRKLKIDDLVDEPFKGFWVIRPGSIKCTLEQAKQSLFQLKKSWLPNLLLKNHTLMNMRKWSAMGDHQRKIKMSPLVTY